MAAFALFAAASATSALAEGGCRLEPDTLERGETRDVLLCGPGLDRPGTISVAAGSAVEVLYPSRCVPWARTVDRALPGRDAVAGCVSLIMSKC
jgi:hypothetical protein